MPANTIKNPPPPSRISSNLIEFMRIDDKIQTNDCRKTGAIASQNRLQRVKSQENFFHAPSVNNYEGIIEIYES